MVCRHAKVSGLAQILNLSMALLQKELHDRYISFVNEPPFALVFLGAEESGRLELRAILPPAVAVPSLGAGVVFEVLFLGLRAFFQVFFVSSFPRPVRVDELAELVDERKEGLGIHGLQLAFGADVVDLDGEVGLVA